MGELINAPHVANLFARDPLSPPAYLTVSHTHYIVGNNAYNTFGC